MVSVQKTTSEDDTSSDGTAKNDFKRLSLH